MRIASIKDRDQNKEQRWGLYTAEAQAFCTFEMKLWSMGAVVMLSISLSQRAAPLPTASGMAMNKIMASYVTIYYTNLYNILMYSSTTATTVFCNMISWYFVIFDHLSKNYRLLLCLIVSFGELPGVPVDDSAGNDDRKKTKMRRQEDHRAMTAAMTWRYWSKNAINIGTNIGISTWKYLCRDINIWNIHENTSRLMSRVNIIIQYRWWIEILSWYVYHWFPYLWGNLQISERKHQGIASIARSQVLWQHSARPLTRAIHGFLPGGSSAMVRTKMFGHFMVISLSCHGNFMLLLMLYMPRVYQSIPTDELKHVPCFFNLRLDDNRTAHVLKLPCDPSPMNSASATPAAIEKSGWVGPKFKHCRYINMIQIIYIYIYDVISNLMTSWRCFIRMFHEFPWIVWVRLIGLKPPRISKSNMISCNNYNEATFVFLPATPILNWVHLMLEHKRAQGLYHIVGPQQPVPVHLPTLYAPGRSLGFTASCGRVTLRMKARCRRRSGKTLHLGRLTLANRCLKIYFWHYFWISIFDRNSLQFDFWSLMPFRKMLTLQFARVGWHTAFPLPQDPPEQDAEGRNQGAYTSW